MASFGRERKLLLISQMLGPRSFSCTNGRPILSLLLHYRYCLGREARFKAFKAPVPIPSPYLLAQTMDHREHGTWNMEHGGTGCPCIIPILFCSDFPSFFPDYVPRCPWPKLHRAQPRDDFCKEFPSPSNPISSKVSPVIKSGPKRAKSPRIKTWLRGDITTDMWVGRI